MKRLRPEDFSRIVLVSSPSLHSSSGIAFLATRTDLEKDSYISQVWLSPLDGGEPHPVTRGPSDQCPRWSPRGDVIAYMSRERPGKGEDEKGAGIWLVRPGGEPWFLAWFPNGVSRWPGIQWLPDSSGILVIAPKGEIHEDVKVIDRIPIWFNGAGWTYGYTNRLFIVYTDNGEVWEPGLGIGEDQDVLYAKPSPDGRRIAYSYRPDRLKPLEHRLRILDLGSGEEFEVLGKPMRIAEFDWSPDGRMLVVRGSMNERGVPTHNKLWLVEAGEEAEPDLLSRVDRNHGNSMNSDSRGPSCGGVLEWSRDGYIYYQLAEGGEVRLYRVKPGSQPELLVKNGVVDEISVMDGMVAYTFMDFNHPKELYLLRGGEIVKITGFNDRLVEEWGLRKPRKLRFKASDGVWIDGWVLEPYSKEGERPAVLEIHGGPKTAYGEGFMFEFHLLASNGYYVLFSNPRGSDGYGEDFADIRGRYGERDYQDLMEFLSRVLEEYREIDGARLGVTGGSYGGFMTNWIIGHTQRFAAAVTQRCCSNWFTSFGATDIGYYFDPDQIGGYKYPWQDPEKYWDKSPLKYVENMSTPLLIIHSLEDYRCHPVEAIQLFTALKVLGRKARLVLFPGENHDLSRSGKPKHRAERLRHILDWFNEHLVGRNVQAEDEDTS